MSHAYTMAKKIHRVDIDRNEIDDKVATGPRKPSVGKTNKYRLKGKGGVMQIQVYNSGNKIKPYELNMYKEGVELGEQPEHEITVGNYTTKFFYMCGSAQKVMKRNANVEGAEELTRMQDDFYKLEKEAMDAGEASEEQKKQAVDLYNKIMKKAGEIGLADDIDDYMKMHIDSMIKGKPELGFGRTDLKEKDEKKGLYYYINKKKKEGRRMRKKGEKGAPKASDFERAAQTAKKQEGYQKFNQFILRNHWGEITESQSIKEEKFN